MKMKAAPNVGQGSRRTAKEQSIPTKDSSEKTFVDKKDDTWDNCHDKGELESSKFIKKESLDDEVMKNNDETHSGMSGTDFHKKSTDTENEERSNLAAINNLMEVNSDVINEKILFLPDESKVMTRDDRPDLCPQTLFQSPSSAPEKNNADVALSNKRQEISRRKKIKVTPVFNKIKKENLKSCSERRNESIDKDINVIPVSVNNKSDSDSIVEQTAAIENDISIKEKAKIEIPFVEKVSESVHDKVQIVGKCQTDELDGREKQNIDFDESPLKELSLPSKKGSTRRSKIRTLPTLITSKKKVKLEKETNPSNRENESRDDYSEKDIKKGKLNEGSLKLEYESCNNRSNDSSVKDYDNFVTDELNDNFVTDELNLKESEKTFKSDKLMDIKSKENMGTNEDMTSKDEILRDGEEGRICQNLEEDEEDEVITVFRERKNEYHKKVREGPLERKGMTMFDLIFYNPQNNPMSGPSKDKRKVNLNDNENEGEIGEIQREEEMADDFGLEGINTEDKQDVSSHELPDIDNPSEENKEGDIKINDGIESDGEDNVLGPKLKIGPDGEIIIDEQSLVIKTTAAKEKDLIMSNSIIVEENNDNIHYGRHNKKRRRSCEWTIKETARFYKALSTVGTDFSLMESLFTWRSRAELKTKFKKEERKCRKLVERALQDDKQFDFTIFDESDYDPEEDRKSVKIEEKKEAKRKKKEKKEKNIKICEIKKKKKVIAEKKSRKSVLRKVFKQKGTKRTYKKKENKSKESLNSTDEADMECNKRNVKKSKTRKEYVRKRKVKKSRVISSDSSSNEENMEIEDKKKEMQSDVIKCQKNNDEIASDDIIPSNSNIDNITTVDRDQWIEQEINSPMPSREAVDLISDNLLFKIDADLARGPSSVIDQDGQLISNNSMEQFNKASMFNVGNDSVSEHIRIDEDVIPHSLNLMCEEAFKKADLGRNKTMKGQTGNGVPDCESLLQSSGINKICNENIHGDLPLERISESLPSNIIKNIKSVKSTEMMKNNDKRSEDKTIDSLRNNILKTTLVENSNNVRFADEISNCEKANVYETHGKDIDIGLSSKEKTNLKETDLKKADEKTIKDETEKIKGHKDLSSNDAGNKSTKASVWHPQKFPVSAIITDLKGNKHIKVTTEQGSLKDVPVPRLPSGTSSIVVVASISTQGTEVYHVFAVAPPCNNES